MFIVIAFNPIKINALPHVEADSSKLTRVALRDHILSFPLTQINESK